MLCACPAFASDSYSPHVGQNFPRQVLWGDTHVHSNLSMDAYSWKNTSLSPADAYRFARGETLVAHNGMKVRLRRPLDFLVVADHAENLGVSARIDIEDPALLATELGQRIVAGVRALRAKPEIDSTEILFYISDQGEVKDSTFRQSVWQQVTNTADHYNNPGRFTAFIAYEWSGTVPIFANLHRVVIFEDDATRANQILPFSRYDSRDPEDLWAFMAGYQKKTGGHVLAIPHNSNLSNGLMFSVTDFAGQPLDQAYSKKRSYWEPLLEVTQSKGDSEAHPTLSPNDEFADFETWNSWLGKHLTEQDLNDDGRFGEYARSIADSDKKQNEYARSALKLGLIQQARLGINPFKFGMIGSTDAHTSLATADDNNFWGKMSIGAPDASRMFGKDPLVRAPWAEFASSGYAAVWATENTREAIFAAMKRKETYATTGPRMTVRFFGGWDFQPDDAFQPDIASIGYRQGVPMGGDLSNAPGNPPSFLIRAIKDPDGANLDRLQVIKGWLDKAGEVHEKIYNVALSDGRKESPGGRVPDVGNSVEISKASYTNSIGDTELAVVWTDPDFDAAEMAFYYVRVLEISTPRWTAYDASFFAIKDIPKDIPMLTRERAYTSPIWYTP